jgi:hypothetical protein
MDLIALTLSWAALSAALVFLRRRRRTDKRNNDVYLERLEEVARSAEETRQSCFASLANMHKSLQNLQARPDTAAEEFSIAPTSGAARKEHYEAAALLLSAGQKADRIAHLLGLPVEQVELVQELRQIVARETPGTSASVNAGFKSATRTRHKHRAPQEKKVAPVLLTDIVDFAPAVGANGSGH